MKNDEFLSFTALLTRLTPSQKKKLAGELNTQASREEGIQLIESRVGEAVKCPHCSHGEVMKYGFVDDLQRYKCKSCRKSFNALTGTPLARLRDKNKLLAYAETMKNGLSLRKAAKECGIHLDRAFRWRHKFLSLPEKQQAKILSGIAEADETFVLNSKKGSRELGRKPRKRGTKATKRGLSDEYVCVLVARDRTGATLDAVMPHLTKSVLTEVLAPALAKDTMLCSDGSPVYKSFVKAEGIAHTVLNGAAGIRVIDKVFHIQNVNAYHSRFKEWLGQFHGVASKYLPNYLGWRRLIEKNQGVSFSAQEILQAALGNPCHYLTRT